MFFLFTLVLLVDFCTHAAAYVNALDAAFQFTCSTSEQTIYSMESYHDNHHEDRQFSFRCRDVLSDNDGTQAACYWTDYKNDYDQPENFECPGNEYVNGMSSIHDNHHEDRRWKFNCCSLPNVHIGDCVLSSYSNDFDGTQSFYARAGTVMKGMDSYHDNHHEDRRYRFYVCVPFRADGPVVGK